jgi:hypothetical protein
MWPRRKVVADDEAKRDKPFLDPLVFTPRPGEMLIETAGLPFGGGSAPHGELHEAQHSQAGLMLIGMRRSLGRIG